MEAVVKMVMAEIAGSLTARNTRKPTVPSMLGITVQLADIF